MIPSFPKYVFIDDSTLQRVQLSNVIRSETEIGAQKTRPIQSIPMFNVVMDISICNSDLINFRTWFKNEIGSGAYWFLLNDPFDGTRRRFRFIETEFSWSKRGNNLLTSINLEAYDEL